MPQMPGGISDGLPVDDNVKDICEKIRSQVEAQAEKFEEFTPIAFKSQIVAGTNFFIKVRISPSAHIHIRVFRSLQGDKLTLHSHQLNKALEDEITYF